MYIWYIQKTEKKNFRNAGGEHTKSGDGNMSMVFWLAFHCVASGMRGSDVMFGMGGSSECIWHVLCSSKNLYCRYGIFV